MYNNFIAANTKKIFIESIERINTVTRSELVILLLYDPTKNPDIYEELTNNFSHLNYNADKDISLISCFNINTNENNTSKVYSLHNNTRAMQRDISKKISDKPFSKESFAEFSSNIKKALEINDESPYVVVFSKGNFCSFAISKDCLKRSLSDLFEVCRCCGYNIVKISERYKSILYEYEKEKFIEWIKYSLKMIKVISTKDLDKNFTIKGDLGKAEIGLVTFVKNYKKYINLSEENSNTKLEELLDDLIKFVEPGNKKNEIKDFFNVEELNFDWFEEASKRNLKLIMKLEGDMGGDYSLLCYLYGKIVETELNLGFVHMIRTSLGIECPDFFDQYKKDAIAFYDHVNYNNENKNENINIKRVNALCYPPISKSKEFVCKNYKDFLNNKKFADKEIEDNIKKLLDGDKVSENISTIIDGRNEAVHDSNVIEYKEYDKVKTAFKNLIDCGFFKVNYELKNKFREEH